MSVKPNLSRDPVPVTDAAEYSVVAQTYCAQVSIQENPSAAGWPRTYMVRLTSPGSAQHNVSPGTSYAVPGAFQPGDVVCTLELASAGGDSSTFNIAELNK